MFSCKFCSKQYAKNAGGMVHQNQCKMNPDGKSYQVGRKAWNAGKNAETDARIRDANIKISNSLKGRKPPNWNPNRESLRQYRTDCAFKFSVYDYPNEFDLSLLEKHGWYSPVNRKNNPTGISRDHMVSVKYGWKNGILAETLAHPANCALMLHSDNVRKYNKNSITFEELQKRILEWEQRYGGVM